MHGRKKWSRSLVGFFFQKSTNVQQIAPKKLKIHRIEIGWTNILSHTMENIWQIHGDSGKIYIPLNSANS